MKRAKIFLIGVLVGVAAAAVVSFDRSARTAQFVVLNKVPAPHLAGDAMPNDCAIVATQAAGRLVSAATWTRILNISYSPSIGQLEKHDVAVWQPPTATKINAYDQSLLNGTAELATESHDAVAIATELAKRWNVTLLEAHFLE